MARMFIAHQRLNFLKYIGIEAVKNSLRPNYERDYILPIQHSPVQVIFSVWIEAMANIGIWGSKIKAT